jgi:WS/DGAT/MGAT family acyltransferase
MVIMSPPAGATGVRVVPQLEERTVAPKTFDRLSAQDSSFLLWEHHRLHMHVGAVSIYETGPLARADGGIDIDRLRAYVDSRIHLLPRYRQRVVESPLLGRPIWVDDDRFNLQYHLRHTSLPRPGTERALNELAGRILSQQLDREKPLWEMWFVEGLADNRFAVIAKTHHCMVDGVSGMSLLTMLLRDAPEDTIAEKPAWAPRPHPGRFDLLVDEVRQRTRVPLGVLGGALRAVRHPRRTAAQLADAADAVRQAVSAGFHVAANTPINRPVGPHRRIEWWSLDLGAVKELKNRLGGTVNDVVLGIATGAMRSFLRERRHRLDEMNYRVVVPVSVRAGAVDERSANRVSAWFVTLPLWERNPLSRFEVIRRQTEQLRASRTAEGTDLLSRFADWAGSTLLTFAGTRLVTALQPYNLIITNVPGPDYPLFLLGARMQQMYPQLPLFENQGLGIAVLSYCGKLNWGLVADWDVVPDLGRLIRALEASFEELRTATVPRAPAARRSRRHTAEAG